MGHKSGIAALSEVWGATPRNEEAHFIPTSGLGRLDLHKLWLRDG